MSTQEKLQTILDKFNLTCQSSIFGKNYFYLINSDNSLVADFDTYHCEAHSFFNDEGYARISNEKMIEIEQEWLKVIEDEELKGVAVVDNNIKWGVDIEQFAEV